MLVCSVNVFGQQLQSVSIEKNVTNNFNLELTANPNNNADKCSYKWNNNNTARTIEINETGTYTVTVTGQKSETITATVECKKLSPDIIKNKIEGNQKQYFVDYDSTYKVDSVFWIKGNDTVRCNNITVEANDSLLKCSVYGFGKIDTIINLKENNENGSDGSKLKSNGYESEYYYEDLQNRFKYVFISGIVLAVLVVLLYVIVFVSKKNRDKNIIKAIRESEDREFKKKILSVVLESQTFKEKLQNEMGKSAANAKSYDSDISALQRRIATLEDSLKKANNAGGSTYASVQQTSAPTPQQPQPSKSLYAESIVDKKFNKVKENPTEDTIFELILVGDTRARVTIYRQAYQKVLAKRDT